MTKVTSGAALAQLVPRQATFARFGRNLDSQPLVPVVTYRLPGVLYERP
jgi:hypothetical protein